MKLVERRFEVPHRPTNWRDEISRSLAAEVNEEEAVLRVVVTKSYHKRLVGEYLVLDGHEAISNIFSFSQREYEDSRTFNTVILIPTGIGAAFGGHDGDGGPVARLFGALSDNVVVHPNVVNASDINEMPENTLYVEGGTLTRLLMGQIALQPVRNNRVLVVVDDLNPVLTNAVVNAVNAARVSYGFRCPKVIRLNPAFRMTADSSATGRATGEIADIERLFEVLDKEEGNFDAVAIASHVSLPDGYHDNYFAGPGTAMNLWGGVESMLSHAVSHMYEVPCAHAPMPVTRSQFWDEVTEPRLAARAISMTSLQSVLKGLQRSPRVVDVSPTFGYQQRARVSSGLFDVANVSLLVIPDGCIGLPTLAALDQGIPVIAVGDNKNMMDNDLSTLPWAPGQFHRAQSYLNAAGIAMALKAGLDPNSLRRPIRPVDVVSHGNQ